MPKYKFYDIIDIDGMEIEIGGMRITLVPSRGKYLRLSVNACTAEVRLSVPRGVPLKKARAFAEEKRDWIFRERQRVIRSCGLERQGEELLFGQRYNVVPTSGTSRLDAQNGLIYLHLADGFADEQYGRALDGFYRRQLSDYIAQRIEELERLVGAKANCFRVRRMTSRHGSCNTATKALTFSTYLAKRPYVAVDYVIVHELTHLLYPNHGREFKAHVARCLPDWKSAKKLLNGE